MVYYKMLIKMTINYNDVSIKDSPDRAQKKGRNTMKKKSGIITKSILCAAVAMTFTFSYQGVSASAASYDYEEEQLSSDASVQKVEVFGVTATKTGKKTYSCTLNEGDHLTDVYPFDFGITTTDDMAEVTNINYNNKTGVATITVTAEDGTKAKYKVYVKEA